MEPLLPTGEEVTRETIARWLKVKGDQVRVCGSVGPRREAPLPVVEPLGEWLRFWSTPVVWLLIIGFVVGPGEPSPGRVLLAFALCGLYAMAVMGYFRPQHARRDVRWWSTVRASADGLEGEDDRGSFRAAWSEVEGIAELDQRDGEGWEVTAAGRRFRLQSRGANVRRLVGTVRSVLAAKAAGRRVWDRASLPEGALSVADDEAEEGNRGLSQVDAS